MSNIHRIDTVKDYTEYVGAETLHPLVSVIDFSTLKPFIITRKSYGIYAVILKDIKCGDLRYGKHYYDYQEGTLVFIAPGQVAGSDEDQGKPVQVKGHALLFHPDLLRNTPLARKIKDCSFFSYEVSESLHMSERERQIIVTCLSEIRSELERGIDKHSKSIIVSNIEVLLNHCMRFYDRQFVTREHVNKDILVKFEQIINSYFEEDSSLQTGLPSVQYFADQLHLSANYFGDLIKKETGKTPQEHIQLKLTDLAKSLLLETNKSVSEIAYELGFKYPHHLSRMFKKNVGISPNSYRSSFLNS